MGAPALSLAAASMWTFHPVGSRVALSILMLSVPGLIIPETALPSQFIMINTSLPATVLPSQTPIHEPFRGKPSWATIGATSAKARKAIDGLQRRLKICMHFIVVVIILEVKAPFRHIRLLTVFWT